MTDIRKKKKKKRDLLPMIYKICDLLPLLLLVLGDMGHTEGVYLFAHSRGMKVNFVFEEACMGKAHIILMSFC